MPPRVFSSTVRRLRLAAGLTQAELAEAAGISERTVSDLERGLRSSVYPATARQLASALQVPPDGLAVFLAAARGGNLQDRSAVQTASVPSVERFSLPVPLTGLVGRETELSVVVNLLREPDVRLITLLGPGGIGKTRLAIEAAREAQDHFGHGSFFIDLSVADDARMVLPLIATAIGVQPATGSLVRVLAERLEGNNALVVLDTFEHLTAAAPSLSDLLTASANLTVLVTSRAPLHVRGEREVPLLPLAVRTTKVKGAKLAPAVELFLERATAVAPTFERSNAAIDAVTDICTRVDGLPLAIELAAARVKHVTVSDLLAQLGHRLDPLVGGPRDLPPRQQTMRAALDWSYELLGESEQELFRFLSVFRGGFGREAAEAVATCQHIAGASNVLSALSALVDSSLVVFEGVTGQARYRLLDVIREYAGERADATLELSSLQRCHAQYFLTVAEQAEPKLRGSEQRVWFAGLAEDEGNFRSALGWALEVGENETALRLAGALWMFWRWAGLFAEGRGWLDAALTAGDACPLAVRCQGLWGAGWLAYHHSDYARTAETGQQMMRLLGDTEDPILRRNALTLVGNAALAQGRTDEAIATLDEAVVLCERLGTSWHLATSLLNLGMGLLHARRTEEARALFERALSIYEQLGDLHFTARVSRALGYADILQGDLGSAAGFIRRGMKLSADLGDAWGIAEGLEAVGTLYSQTAPRNAALLSGAAEQLRERISMGAHPVDAGINREYLEFARAGLTPPIFEEAWTEGRGMSAELAVAVALESDPALPVQSVD